MMTLTSHVGMRPRSDKNRKTPASSLKVTVRRASSISSIAVGKPAALALELQVVPRHAA